MDSHPKTKKAAASRKTALRLWLRLSELSWKQWLAVIAVALVIVVLWLFRPVETKPKAGLEHRFAIEAAEFLPTITGATDTPFQAGDRQPD